MKTLAISPIHRHLTLAAEKEKTPNGKGAPAKKQAPPKEQPKKARSSWKLMAALFGIPATFAFAFGFHALHLAGENIQLRSLLKDRGTQHYKMVIMPDGERIVYRIMQVDEVIRYPDGGIEPLQRLGNRDVEILKTERPDIYRYLEEDAVQYQNRPELRRFDLYIIPIPPGGEPQQQPGMERPAPPQPRPRNRVSA